MKRENTVCRSDDVSLETSQMCCLARVNALLKSLRVKNDLVANSKQSAHERTIELWSEDLSAPTLHDAYFAELEAYVAPESCVAAGTAERVIVHDSPQEVARARLVFTATLVVPLLLITTGLALFSGQLGRASTSLLQFSALAVATPLILALVSTIFQSRWQGIHRRPVLALIGVVATAGYATSAYGMTGTGAGTTSVLALSTAGLLVLVMQFRQWLIARKTIR